MKVENAVVPNKEQIEGFAKPGPDGPIYMLNLLKFKEHAEYEDGRKVNLTGREAYAIYGAAVAKILVELGGGAMFVGQVERLVLGEVEELWDQVAIAVYPNRKAMLDMMMSPAYQEIAVHRAAGLAGQLNLELTDGAGMWLAQNAG